MIQFLRQKQATFLFIGLAFCMLVLMSHEVGNRGGTDVAEELLFKAGSPAVRAGSSVTSYVSDFFKNYADLRNARTENRRLSEALLRTERERDRLRQLAAAGERLQELLDLRRTLPEPGIGARVVGSGFPSGRATLILDRGSVDGIASGMPVIAVGGVVGRVVLVSPSLSKVVCITEPASGVAVTMQDSGYQGILVGRKTTSAELQYLPPYAEVSAGDLVVSNGLDQIYPPGIPVGRIIGRPDGEGVSRRFEVKPLVDFDRLAEVLVLRAAPRPRGALEGPLGAGGGRTTLPRPDALRTAEAPR